MNPLGRALYFLQQAVRLARSAPWLTFVSVLTMAVSLSLIGLFAMALFSAGEMVSEIGGSLTVSIYVEGGASQARLDSIEAQVRGHEKVTAVRVLTPEMDRERNRELLDKKLLEGLDEEAIPGQPVVEVTLDSALGSRGDLDELAAWAERIRGVEAVQDVEFGAERLRLLFAIVDIVRTVGLLLSVVLLASALFFVFSTIRLAVFSQKEEIEILALVGATPTFVRLPFFIEGALQGLVGAMVAMMFCGFLHLELEALVRDAYGINLTWSLLPPGMIAWLLLGGPLLGLAASGVSVGRYLKIQ